MKIFISIFVSLILIGIAVYLYIFRELEINLDLIPEHFEYCNQTIITKDKAYQEIFELLKQNKDGWVQSPATYAPMQTYQHNDFTIIVLKNALVVSYKVDGKYKQLVQTINHGLATKCP
ncbi:hypothetical protein [Kangiella sp. M94]